MVGSTRPGLYVDMLAYALSNRPISPRYSRFARRLSAAVTAALCVVLIAAPIASAVPSPADTKALLEVTKEVTTPTNKTVQSGGEITWTVTVNCQSQTVDCWDATLTDTIPAPFTYVPGSLNFTSDGSYPDPTVTEPAPGNGETLSVVFNDVNSDFPGRKGLSSGHGMVFSMTALLPVTTVIPPGGQNVPNTANLTSTDEFVKDDTSTDIARIEFVPVLVPQLTKTWSEDSVVAGDSGLVNVTLDAYHSSNLPAKALVIADPASGSTAFASFSFAGFTGLTLPASADQVTVSLAIQGGTSAGFPTAGALPTDVEIAAALTSAGKTLADVVGVTVTVSHSSGDDVVVAGQHAIVKFAMAQRGTLSAADSPVNNIASATVSTSGFGEVSTTASDSIVVESPSLSASATKVYTSAAGAALPNSTNIVTGQTFGAKASVTSTGNVPLTALTVSDPAQYDAATLPATYNFATQGVTFVGFGTNGTNVVPLAGTVPAGTTSAAVTFTYADDANAATPETETLPATLGATEITFPTPAAGRTVIGFAVNFTGNLAANASSTIPYRLVAKAVPVLAQNSADGQVAAGSDTAVAPPAIDTVNIVEPRVESRTDKAIAPSVVSTAAGSTFLTVLTSRLDKIDGSPLSNIPVDRLVIEDSINTPPTSGTSVWGSSFRPTGLAASALPAGVKASFEVLTAGSTTDWNTLAGLGNVTGAVPATTFAAAVDGVRVTYTRTDGQPLDESQRYRTLINWTAATANPAATYLNLATSQATGTNPADLTPVVGPLVADTDDVTTATGPGNGVGESPIKVATSKTWTVSDAVSARALRVPLWVPDSGSYPTFGLNIGVQNSSDNGIPVDSLSMVEPAVGPQAVGGSTVAQTDPFDSIRLVSLQGMNVPVSADASTLSATLTLKNGTTATFTAAGVTRPAQITSLRTQVNAYLGTHTDVVRIKFDVNALPGGIETGEAFNARFATQVRETTLSGVPIDPAVLAITPETINNAISGDAVYGAYTANAGAQDSLELRALSTQEVTVQAIKSLSPTSGTILSANPGATTTMVLGANKFAANATAPDRDSYSNPISYEITDITPAFWEIFSLRGLTGVVGEPTSSTIDVKFGIEYLIGGVWLSPAGVPVGGWDVPQGTGFQPLPAAAALPPAGQSFADVTGVRVKFFTADGASRLPDMSSSTSSLSDYGQKLRLAFDLRPTFRTSGDAIPDGTSVINTVNVTARNAQNKSAVDDAPATFTVTNRASGVTISKTPADQTLDAGADTQFVLTLKNTGTTALHDLVLTDTIACVAGQPDMVYDTETAQITLGTGATDAAGVTTDLDDVEIVYTDGCVGGVDTISIALPQGNTVLPGETYAVTVPLTVRPGHAPGSFLNSYGLSYIDELGSGTVSPVTAQVNVRVAQGYRFSKFVREVVDTDAGQTLTGITGTCQGDDADYLSGVLSQWQRYPCIIQTRPGGTAEWRLSLTNSGNQPTKKIVAVDVLPTPGDVGITTGLSGIQRQSTYTPTLLAGIDVVWRSGTEGTLEISYQTAGDGSCVLSGGVTETDPFSPACVNWRTDWNSIKNDPVALATVTALKFEVTYPDDALLQPSEAVEIYYRTQNPEVLPAAAPAGDAPAWNSFGGWAQTVTNPADAPDTFVYSYFRTAPIKAGIAFSQPEQPLALGDRVWLDANRNGLQDPSEKPLAGVTVRLHDLDGSVLKQTTTDANGYYVFEGLFPGTYKVSFELTAGQKTLYRATTPRAGNGAVDSNIAAAPGAQDYYWTDAVTIEYPSRGGSTGLITAEEYNALGLQRIAVGSYINPTIDAGFVLIAADAVGGGGLAITGADVLRALGLGAAMLLGGMTLLVARRRQS